jgi:hypothetical protein
MPMTGGVGNRRYALPPPIENFVALKCDHNTGGNGGCIRRSLEFGLEKLVNVGNDRDFCILNDEDLDNA